MMTEAGNLSSHLHTAIIICPRTVGIGKTVRKGTGGRDRMREGNNGGKGSSCGDRETEG